ncbi:TPA: hypothetical protein DCP77_04135 [Candidatus Collierbacteria bacterium]|nr:MAG: hypothetical protein UV37_C0013G0013 [Candidatus Collierbacteria bacterium GW2011_GWA1_42_60]HAI22771.1 hypothetical protein [Candidatus Collierbacteria bacterium]HAN22934.1 hypothetical protein [Candidatus Collierbacteria bacterium]HAS69373.1 hypothetical protein [Candidatus Collierbacteria bacterium]HBX64191.1 hypothetical protein [Candidatus Collierbacteria bacterium]
MNDALFPHPKVFCFWYSGFPGLKLKLILFFTKNKEWVTTGPSQWLKTYNFTLPKSGIYKKNEFQQ